MLGKTDFYTLNKVTENEDSTSYTITINKNHPIFKGHFPGNPVTPGVAQMDIVKELVAKHLQKEVSMEEMPSCKFLAVLNPETNADVDVILKFSKEDAQRVSVVIKDAEVSYLKMVAVYR
ncbi:MAG TPA: 3-hydroxyacyl-ACP dehydratase [Crocinitomicaceae bacterium]|nr:3-hydroxyacyl-ACP dehydratase [Crocinitomicaceae bacterium]